VVLTGGRDERDFNRRIAAGLAPVIDVTGMTSLKTLAELYRQADLLVCPDTGPMHVAAAVGCPAVALFGPTAPWRTGPYGAAHRVLRASMTCAPCFRKKCSDHHCMADIPPERVVSEIKDVLAPRKVELEDSPY
jgi:ADP-heptose:LPS heptosyltransferase